MAIKSTKNTDHVGNGDYYKGKSTTGNTASSGAYSDLATNGRASGFEWVVTANGSGFQSYNETFQVVPDSDRSPRFIGYPSATFGVQEEFNEQSPMYYNNVHVSPDGTMYPGALDIGGGKIVTSLYPNSGSAEVPIVINDIYDVEYQYSTGASIWSSTNMDFIIHQQPGMYHTYAPTTLTSSGATSTSIGNDIIVIGTNGVSNTAILMLNGESKPGIKPFGSSGATSGLFTRAGDGVVVLANYANNAAESWKPRLNWDRLMGSIGGYTTVAIQRISDANRGDHVVSNRLSPRETSLLTDVTLNRFGDLVAVGQGRIAVIESATNSSSPQAHQRLWIYDLNGNIIRCITAPTRPTNGYGRQVVIGNGFIFVSDDMTEQPNRTGIEKNAPETLKRGRIFVYTLDGKHVDNYYGSIKDEQPEAQVAHDMSAKYGCLSLSYGGFNNANSFFEVPETTTGILGILEQYQYINDPESGGQAPSNVVRDQAQYDASLISENPHIDVVGSPAQSYTNGGTVVNKAVGMQIGINGHWDVNARIVSNEPAFSTTNRFSAKYDNTSPRTGDNHSVNAIGENRALSLSKTGKLLASGAGGTVSQGDGFTDYQITNSLANYFEDKVQRRSFRKSRYHNTTTTPSFH